ncbi:aminotransferase class III-fold pyridoxal phosphate-dependent enzyme, partial [Paraburkholderia sp. SIMBA_049]
GYHGSTIAGGTLGGMSYMHEQMPSKVEHIVHIDQPYFFGEAQAGETPEAFGLARAQQLEAKILELGAENVAAFVAETVVGATAGAVPPVRTYLKKIRAVCDKYGVLLILDEIMSGMGRTGYLFACDDDDVAPDLLTIAKGLGAGYQPIGATLV